jgi:regulator of sirC expression with transglutaminase-like and TPR domain
VDATLLRIDALADQLKSSGFVAMDPAADAAAVAEYLAHGRGFTGATEDYYDPANALLTQVLDRRRGLPITLTMLFVAIARRVGVPAFPIALPGHVVAGVAGADRPVVVDPFHDGALLDDDGLVALLSRVSGGQATYHRAMLRPSPAVEMVRRLLNNLTRDFHAAGDVGNALWTVELKLLLPNQAPEDHRVLGDLLEQLGTVRGGRCGVHHLPRRHGSTTSDAEEIRRSAIRAKARLN